MVAQVFSKSTSSLWRPCRRGMGQLVNGEGDTNVPFAVAGSAACPVLQSWWNLRCGRGRDGERAGGAGRRGKGRQGGAVGGGARTITVMAWHAVKVDLTRPDLSEQHCSHTMAQPATFLRAMAVARARLAVSSRRAPFVPRACARVQLSRIARFQSTASPPPSSTAPQSRLDRDQVPSYELTFTCNVCKTRSSHRLSKQGYHHGTVLISCPDCKNKHLISDHLKVCRLSRTIDLAR